MEGIEQQFEEMGKQVMPQDEIEEYLKEEKEVRYEIAVTEELVERMRGDLHLTEGNPRWRDVIDLLNNTPEGRELLEVLFNLEEEVKSITQTIMQELLTEGKKFELQHHDHEKILRILAHAHREIKRSITRPAENGV